MSLIGCHRTLMSVYMYMLTPLQFLIMYFISSSHLQEVVAFYTCMYKYTVGYILMTYMIFIYNT